MKLIILSDIHANLTAFDAVMADAKEKYAQDSLIIHLGDVINYGMRPNETFERLSALGARILVNLAGNHERAVLGLDVERFSSKRGVDACYYTRSILVPPWIKYIQTTMMSVPMEKDIDGYRMLFVHGDLSDPFWGGMPVEESERDIYSKYDYVICGHTHIPFLAEKFFLDNSQKGRRGKRKTIFLNPGSVGQPRNHNAAAQYVVLDTGTGSVIFNAVPYDVDKEIALYKGEIDLFYAKRLRIGI